MRELLALGLGHLALAIEVALVANEHTKIITQNDNKTYTHIGR